MSISVILLGVYIAATVIEGQRELPIGISPVTIPGTTDGCPSDDSRQASRSFLQNTTCEIISSAMASPISLICGPGEWRRVFYLNASASDQSCPDQWNLYSSPVRGCGGTHSSCLSAFSDEISLPYYKVCGRIIGEGVSSVDGFFRSPLQNTIEGNYLDGVSVTHGASGSRMHIWTFGAGHPNRCPCDNSNRDSAPLPPGEVGDNYFCDTANQVDPVWTGESCANDNPCCSFNNPPYFSVQLPAATTDRIELRICIDSGLGDESVLVLFAELYVQ